MFYIYYIENDTLFFFNFRADRMRQIVQTFGIPPPPFEVKVPENLVRFILNFKFYIPLYLYINIEKYVNNLLIFPFSIFHV
jgi:hypothetical protein